MGQNGILARKWIDYSLVAEKAESNKYESLKFGIWMVSYTMHSMT